MAAQRLIVVSLSGLATAGLTCYGSSWNDTDEVDVLASEGTVWDRFITTDTSPRSVLRQWITDQQSDWISAWRDHGSVELYCDDERLIDTDEVDAFDVACLLDEADDTSPTNPATEIEETQMGRLVAEVLQRLEQDRDWGLLWLHSSFLTECWDAPRFLFPVDEDDDDEIDPPKEDVELLQDPDVQARVESPPPMMFDSVTPPVIQLRDDEHPDLITAWMRTYGCQVRLVDLLLGILSEAARKAGATLVLVGTSGFSLGQNGFIGHCLGPLRSCQVRLPLIIQNGPPIRVRKVEPTSHFPALLKQLSSQNSVDPTSGLVPADDWSADESEFFPAVITRSTDETLDRQHATNQSEIAITTPRWFMVTDGQADPQLFLKPDDLEDFNDVSRLSVDIVDNLRQLITGDQGAS